MTLENKRKIEILLAEDELADVELVRVATKQFTISNNLSVVPDGIELLRFLRKEDEYKNCPSPDLVLLDLNMPRKNGREALEEIRRDPKLSHQPVVVMTSSGSDDDVYKSYRLHANCYIRKPITMLEFEHVIRELERFWFSVVTLPPSQRNSELI